MTRGVLAALVMALVFPHAGAAAVERRLAFVPEDPLAAKQWYLLANRAFDFWPAPPLLPPVRVAVIDSGVDRSHPEFEGKIVDGKSFVGGSPYVDR
ncbi:MAG: hypothetical protein H0V45_08525, partial [Actinobacteria bacterium]|nr:hypothetical protein [Actinomycetota bacterium]